MKNLLKAQGSLLKAVITMTQVCLDNDIAIDFLRGERNAVEKLRYYADNEEICISPFLLMQLNLSIRKQQTISGFVSNVTILPFDKKAASIAVRIIQETREKGYGKNLDNVITAAVCIANQAFLFTKDRKKYQGIKELKLV